MGTGSFRGWGVKRLGRGIDHSHPSSAEVEGRVELYFYSPSGPLWPILERTLPLYIEQTVSYRPLWILVIPLFKILHFCSGGYKENCLLGCDAMLSGRGRHCCRATAMAIFRIVGDGCSRFL